MKKQYVFTVVEEYKVFFSADDKVSEDEILDYISSRGSDFYYDHLEDYETVTQDQEEILEETNIHRELKDLYSL